MGKGILTRDNTSNLKFGVDNLGNPGYIVNDKFFYFNEKIAYKKRMVVSGYNYDRTQSAAPIQIDGTQIASSGGRGHTLYVFNLKDLSLTFKQTYDTYGNSGLCGTIANKILEYDENYLIILNTMDAIAHTSALNTVLNQYGANTSYTCGATRISEVFIGRKGMQSGDGIFLSSTANITSTVDIQYNNATNIFIFTKL